MTEKTKRRWGHYFVLDEGVTISENYKVKMLYLDPMKSISRQYHNHREEYWIIMQGVCEMSLDSNIMIRKRGDMIQIPKRSIHKVKNVSNEDLIILELQIGEEANEEDIVRLETINGEI